jgi:RNA polymerase sigma-70 factor, ECF subfamily
MSKGDFANDPGSKTRLLGELRSKDARLRNEAAEAIWNTYCQTLLDLACRSLDQRLQRRIGPEDVVQRTFKSFFLRQQRGQFDLASRDDLLRLLMNMTQNKARGAATRETRRRRDYRRDQAVKSVAGDPGDSDAWLLDRAEQGMPTPAEAAEFAEEAERRLARLPEDLRRIALYKLEGYTNAEIASLPDKPCSERTVERKLKLIREAWGDGG